MPRKWRHTFTTTADDGVWLFVSGKLPIEIDAWSHGGVSPVVKSARCAPLLGGSGKR
jgi:hypothetical protein